MAVTINTGTTAPTTVLIESDDLNINAQEVFIYEQISAGVPSVTNSVLLGATSTTPTGGSFGGTDTNNEDIAVPVVLSGLTSYTLGATGATGDIFFVGNNGSI